MALNNVILTVPDVMGWSKSDTLALTKWLNSYANLLGKNSEEKAVEIVRSALVLEGEFPACDISQWLHAVISLIFYELLTLLRKNGTVKHTNLEQLEKSFSPFINYADSRFNNCFDNIDFEQEKESIMEQTVKLIWQI